MKINNVRLALATNSSSSHSLIFAPEANIQDSDLDDNSFGWNFFTAASVESRKNYMAAMLKSNMDFPEPIQKLIFKGLELPYDKDAYIDHQSLYTLPHEFGTDTISIDFFTDFYNYIMQDGVVILGGNDNDENNHPLSHYNELNLGNWRTEGGACVCRKDGDWWTLFMPKSGSRVILSFVDNPSEYAPSTPLLIDAKITDYCNHGCEYCYQGSTVHGQHMDKDKVYTYANMIAEAKVFEVAIGGGEPTQCPHFEDFITYLKDYGVVPNFTTKSTDWLEDEKRANKIMDTIGAFAFSYGSKDNLTVLKRIKTIFEYRKYDMEQFTLQIVPATMSQYQIESCLTWAKDNYVKVTLLGFKETGRGAQFKEIAIKRRWDKFDESQFLKVLDKLNKEHKLGRISIDTTLASAYTEQLKTLGIPEYMYKTKEGEVSLYLDLVTSKYGPSSYHIDKLNEFSTRTHDIQTMFENVEAI